MAKAPSKHMPKSKKISISPTMAQAALAAKLEPLDVPCYGDIDCDCGRRLCASQNHWKNLE